MRRHRPVTIVELRLIAQCVGKYLLARECLELGAIIWNTVFDTAEDVLAQVDCERHRGPLVDFVLRSVPIVLH